MLSLYFTQWPFRLPRKEDLKPGATFFRVDLTNLRMGMDPYQQMIPVQLEPEFRMNERIYFRERRSRKRRSVPEEEFLNSKKVLFVVYTKGIVWE